MSKAKKNSGAESNQLAPCTSKMDGEVVPRLVVGTTGRLYCGREVVSCVLPGGLFGTRRGKRDRRVEYTLHNGLLNQCTMSKDGEKPSPYWAVLDAAITMRNRVIRQQVIDKAVEMVGEESRKACEIAWAVLRNHHRHLSKRDAGMVVMFDVVDEGDETKKPKMILRPRDEGETLQYFEAQSQRKPVEGSEEEGAAVEAEGVNA